MGLVLPYQNQGFLNLGTKVTGLNFRKCWYKSNRKLLRIRLKAKHAINENRTLTGGQWRLQLAINNPFKK